jgi:hypothetical protein
MATDTAAATVAPAARRPRRVLDLAWIGVFLLMGYSLPLWLRCFPLWLRYFEPPR